MPQRGVVKIKRGREKMSEMKESSVYSLLLNLFVHLSLLPFAPFLELERNKDQ